MTENKKYIELLWHQKYDKLLVDSRKNIVNRKKKPIEKPNLPFQTVETVNEPRMKEYEKGLGKTFYPKSEYPENYPKDWKNLLIWGDNKLVMSSLIKQGWAGKINLIYIDPPFFTGADFTKGQRWDFLQNKEKYMGKMVEIKGFDEFTSGLLRHPNFVRFRPDKEVNNHD